MANEPNNGGKQEEMVKRSDVDALKSIHDTALRESRDEAVRLQARLEAVEVTATEASELAEAKKNFPDLDPSIQSNVAKQSASLKAREGALTRRENEHHLVVAASGHGLDVEALRTAWREIPSREQTPTRLAQMAESMKLNKRIDEQAEQIKKLTSSSNGEHRTPSSDGGGSTSHASGLKGTARIEAGLREKREDGKSIFAGRQES